MLLNSNNKIKAILTGIDPIEINLVNGLCHQPSHNLKMQKPTFHSIQRNLDKKQFSCFLFRGVSRNFSDRDKNLKIQSIMAQTFDQNEIKQEICTGQSLPI